MSFLLPLERSDRVTLQEFFQANRFDRHLHAADNGWMRRLAVIVVVNTAFVTAMLLAPFTHLHLGGATPGHADHPDHGAHGLVHAHLVAHHHDSHFDTAVEQWVHHDGQRVVPLNTMLSEPGKSAPPLAALEAAYVPPEREHPTGQSVLTLPRAHGPPDGFPVVGRAPPA